MRLKLNNIINPKISTAREIIDLLKDVHQTCKAGGETPYFNLDHIIQLIKDKYDIKD